LNISLNYEEGTLLWNLLVLISSS